MRNKNKIFVYVIIFFCSAAILSAATFLIFKSEFVIEKNDNSPEKKLREYMAWINDGKFDEMYDSLSELSRASISREDFIGRNQNIYEGIEAEELVVEITGSAKTEKSQVKVDYKCTMQTVAGEISFSNKALFVKNVSDKKDKEFYLLWSPQLILPMLEEGDKIRVNTLPAERGAIFDRNGFTLAGKGSASSVGFVPNKMGEDKEGDIRRAAMLLETTPESIREKLSASYVREDMFVSLKTIQGNQDELEAALLEIKGIKIVDTPVRYYPLGEKASHITGYIQNVNAEDLEKLDGKIYKSSSVIGRSGLEKLYEESLRGQDGYEIIITDAGGNAKKTLLKKDRKNGKDIYLTIDAWLQSILYDQFSDDKSCSVVMNHATGEVLALVSTPSFDANDFVLGMSQHKWDSLNNDEDKPLYNRFKAALVPGSCFKAIVGAIGITAGVINPGDDYGSSGISWQKDASWGRYFVTTMTTYPETANLENALVYSDNIYFAKAALKMGGDLLAEYLFKIGFDETIPFEIGLFSSSFSATNQFENEIQLADSGYGQAQIITNPIHMASIFSAFSNKGSMLKPYLLYRENPVPEFWKENVFSEDAARIILEDLKQVMRRGTGRTAQVEGLELAGKTGTAEVKRSKDDLEGIELGWLSVMTTDENIQTPLLLVTMVEDVERRDGSRYVTQGVKKVLELYTAKP